MTLFTDRFFRWIVGGILLSAFLVGGCAPATTTTAQTAGQSLAPELQEKLQQKPETLRPAYQKLYQEGQRNAILNFMEIGVSALEQGHYQLSEDSFEQALVGIETVYANNPEAAKARSLWYEEGSKDFKGEPYERAMAYYYRGLLYMVNNDYENARACFRGGMLQDAFAEEEQFQCDFALLVFLEGWASQQLGDNALANEAYAELKKLRPDFELPKADDNSLLIIETGRAPRKLSDGIGHAELVFRRGKHFKEERAKVDLTTFSEKAYPMEDVYFQARTRGGRPIDKILEGKVAFLKTGTDISSGLTETASTAMHVSHLTQGASGSVANIGAAVAGVGSVVGLIALNAKPHADTRYWHNLPDLVHVFTFSGNADQVKGIEYFDSKTQPVAVPSAKIHAFNSASSHTNLLWTRSRTGALK